MGSKQLGFSDYELTTAKRQTKREKFFSEMEVVVPAKGAVDRLLGDPAVIPSSWICRAFWRSLGEVSRPRLFPRRPDLF
jgi:hypothetical protein